MDGADKAIEQITDRLLQITDQIVQNAGPAGKAAWEVPMAALRIEAWANIGIGIALIPIAAAAGIAALRLFRKAGQVAANSKARSRIDMSDGSEIPWAAGGIFAIIAAAMVGMGAGSQILNAATWVTAFSPEAGLALRILNGL